MTVRKRSTTASPVNLLISLIIFSFFTLFTYSLWKRPPVNAGGLFPFLRAFFQGGRCPPWIRFRFRRNRTRYPPLVRTADEAAPPRRGQWSKSPAKLDFYGDFYAALCGAPVLPVLPRAKCGRRLRPKGAKRHAFGVPFPLFSRCFLFILICLFLYIMYIPVALYEL